MCKYSLEGYATRTAKEGETLIANKHEAAGHGCLTQPGTSKAGTLTCMRHDTVLTIEKLQLIDTTRVGLINKRGGTVVDDSSNYIGKRHVVKFIDATHTKIALDMIEFADGNALPLSWIKAGTEVYVGVKAEPVTLEQKLGVDEKGLRAARLDIADPNPKPEDDDKKNPEKEATEEQEKKPDDDKIAARATRPRVRRRTLLDILR